VAFLHFSPSDFQKPTRSPRQGADHVEGPAGRTRGGATPACGRHGSEQRTAGQHKRPFVVELVQVREAGQDGRQERQGTARRGEYARLARALGGAAGKRAARRVSGGRWSARVVRLWSL
jgi:hypothetical protein